MQRLGFIHDMLDVKVLILFVASRSVYPMTMQEIYELCFQDECLSYFDVCTAIPEMVKTGHLQQVGADKYVVTEKGREQGEVTADSIAYTVKMKAMAAVDEFNSRTRKSNCVCTRIATAENGEMSVIMSLDNDSGNMMKLEIAVPNQKHAEKLSCLMEEKGEALYHMIINELLTAEESLEN